jgi:hypothetical protein
MDKRHFLCRSRKDKEKFYKNRKLLLKNIETPNLNVLLNKT